MAHSSLSMVLQMGPSALIHGSVLKAFHVLLRYLEAASRTRASATGAPSVSYRHRSKCAPATGTRQSASQMIVGNIVTTAKSRGGGPRRQSGAAFHISVRLN